MLHIWALAVASGVLAESVRGATKETATPVVGWSGADGEGRLVESVDVVVSPVAGVAAGAAVSPRVCDLDSQNFR